MKLSWMEISWEKLVRAFKHLFSKEGRNMIRRVLRHDLSVPLFMVQSRFPQSYIPAPASVIIEITNRCNLKCLMCVRRYWDPDANTLGDMTYEFFERNILVHLKPYQHVNLQGVGESLISENFLPMLKACKNLGCGTTFITNGVSLKKYADVLVSIGVDEIRLSIDGTESMKKIRNITINKVIEAIDAVNEAKIKYKRKQPAICINYVLTRDTLPELPELVEIVSARGISKIIVVHLIIHDSNLIEQSVIPIYSEAKHYLDIATSAARKYGIDLELPPEPGSKCICYQPFRMIYVNWYGDVRPCCMSTINEKGALLVGNLNDSTLPELWNNTYMHKLRKSLITEKQMLEMCVLCPMRVFTMESHIHLLENGSKNTSGLPAK